MIFRTRAWKAEMERNEKLFKALEESNKSLQQRNLLLDEKVQRLESENDYLKAFTKSAMTALNQPAVFSKDQVEGLASLIAGIVLSSLKKPGDLN